MKVRLFSAGHCTAPGKIANRRAPWASIDFPAPFALIEHPAKGCVLFDTGYHPRFFTATSRFPEKLYAFTTPCFVEEHQAAAAQLLEAGVDAAQIKHLVLSHLHGDHVCGCLDFPEATFYSQSAGWRFISTANRLTRTRKGYLRQLLPGDFKERSQFIDDFSIGLSDLLECTEHESGLRAHDLFGDNSMYLVNLPGHAAGHSGLLVRLQNNWMFLLADACWLVDNLNEGNNPHPVANGLYDSAPKFYETLSSLRVLYLHTQSYVQFVPSHCKSTIAKLCEQGWIV